MHRVKLYEFFVRSNSLCIVDEVMLLNSNAKSYFPVNFDALYAQSLAQQASQAETVAAETETENDATPDAGEPTH